MLRRAKTTSEWQAWAVSAQQSRWSLVVINPTIVVGPPLAANKQSEVVTNVKRILSAHLPFAFPMDEPKFCVTVLQKVGRAQFPCLHWDCASTNVQLTFETWIASMAQASKAQCATERFLAG